LLIDACLKEDIKLGIVTIINDTVGTLLACSLENECQVGVVLATGFNVAYIEHGENVSKLKNLQKKGMFLFS